MKRITSRILSLIFLAVIALTSFAYNKDRYVVMISLDGYRADYTQWYDTPLMDRMAEEGVEAGLIPCFPSKTFPNHYSIATGLTPDHHGIIANSFLERSTGTLFSLGNPATKSLPRFWGGEPLWLTAKHQGVRTSVFYWPGSDVCINGEYPDSYLVYDQMPRLSMEQRVDAIIRELQKPEDLRPHLIMGYMEEPDHSGHTFGPQDKRTRKAVQYVDSLLMKIYNSIHELSYGSQIDFLVVADHGMTLVTPEQTISVNQYLKSEWYEAVEGNMPANIYVREGCLDLVYDALKDVPHLTVWKKGTDAYGLRYGSNPNCGDIIASPDLGWIFWDGKTILGGMHGFDPAFNDMHALFRAIGPDFRNVSVPHFSNVNVYPLVCHILGITPSPNDGSLDNVRDILTQP